MFPRIFESSFGRFQWFKGLGFVVWLGLFVLVVKVASFLKRTILSAFFLFSSLCILFLLMSIFLLAFFDSENTCIFFCGGPLIANTLFIAAASGLLNLWYSKAYRNSPYDLVCRVLFSVGLWFTCMGIFHYQGFVQYKIVLPAVLTSTLGSFFLCLSIYARSKQIRSFEQRRTMPSVDLFQLPPEQANAIPNQMHRRSPLAWVACVLSILSLLVILFLEAVRYLFQGTITG